jgi:sodium/proline symporter
MDKSVVILVSFVLYLGLMLAIGGYFYYKTKNLSDYVLGGRQLGKWVTSLSAQASDMSGWLLMGLPGAAYAMGLSGAFWMALGLLIGTYLNWKIVAKRFRIYTEKLGNAITLSSYFEARFDDHSKKLRLISSTFILIFFLIYTASGFVAGGKLFSGVFGLSYSQAVWIGAAVVIAYTFLGGFMAVCWTDLIQGLVMFVTILVLPFIVLYQVGSLELIQSLDEVLFNPFYIPYLIPENSASTIGMAVIGIISSMAWGLGYFGQPHILMRFMAIKDANDIASSRRIAMAWVGISLISAIAVGIVGHIVFPNLESQQYENVFILLVDKFSPLFLAGILLSAILAAIMSTADSQLLVTASTISEDFYKGVLKPQAKEKELMQVGRWTVLIVALLAVFIALKPDSSVLNLVSYAWAGFGAAFGPVVLVSLFSRKMTKEGAVWGMLAGGGTVIVWMLLKNIFPGIWIFSIYEMIPGFLSALLFIYIGSVTHPIEMQKMEEKMKNLIE